VIVIIDISPLIVYPLAFLVSMIRPVGTIVGAIAAIIYTIALILWAGF
jgi:hypothetical protein